ncbi:MAG: substrate-binding domain-containing protein [bacterium]
MTACAGARAGAAARSLAFAAWCGAAFSGCGEPGSRLTRGEILVSGSDAALALMRAEADSFMAIYADARIHVEGGGSVLGLEALINKKADAAFLSREPSERERAIADNAGAELAVYPFARDGLAIIVRRDNPVYALAFDEARSIFAGQTARWSEIGGNDAAIVVYKSHAATGAAGFVQETLLDGAAFAAGAIEARTTREIAEAVALDANAIGFASMTEIDDRVKALPLSPKEGGPLTVMNAETVYRQSYPLTRTFCFVTRGIPRDNLVSGFVSYAMSNPGQKIVLQSGFVPATVPVTIKHEG